VVGGLRQRGVPGERRGAATHRDWSVLGLPGGPCQLRQRHRPRCQQHQRHSLHLPMLTVSRYASVYRPLSAFETKEIADILKCDSQFAVCLFPIANGALFEQKW